MSFTIGWFTTAEDSKAQSLFTDTCEAIQDLNLDVKIAYLFCNRQIGEDPKSDQFLTSVQGSEIDLITHSSTEFQKNLHHHPTSELSADETEEYHHQVIEKIASYPVDIVILVGYTPQVTMEFIKKYHTLQFRSALPNGPSGNWPTIIWQLIGTRAAESGATIHLLTEEDPKRGIPVTYGNYSIKNKDFSYLWQDLDQKMKSQSLSQLIAGEGEDNPLFKAIREAGEEVETPLLILTLQELSNRVITIVDQSVYCEGDLQPSGCCLSDEIEDFLYEEEEEEEIKEEIEQEIEEREEEEKKEIYFHRE